MDITQSLKDAENSLRDLVSLIMSEKFGNEWLNNVEITKDKINEWKKRKEDEKKRKTGGETDSRLIYYADFHDVKNIILKNWDLFNGVFSSKKATETFLEIIADYRNPDAHRRELLPHQKNLLIGVSGEIRNQIIRYHSKRETAEDCFPRIEFIRDSLNNHFEKGKGSVNTGMTLRPGDHIDFVVSAYDPEGEQLEYKFQPVCGDGSDWCAKNNFTLKITEKNISKNFSVLIYMRSKRNYHALQNHDDVAMFQYSVLPRIKE